ncbi:response regulator transcription factor [Pseudomonas sp. ANT_J12]|jgi:two-component system response regulator EvgA|uniref:response regulator transcription factor n=1 Tax=Pseudomonas sp. ANT_J12 TaxID=2597351 RepID=UPI0011F1CB78|nr:response regulator transcription factor [Pseudomonas sp. ANT_J12]KAA0983006.1 response regulator transcription factor [Pseudomonas sp. ANT_J12]
MKVLLVDDHAVVRMALGMILTREGHEIVAECDNGVDALSKAFELQPDAIVLDLDIPQLDGMAVLDRLRVGGNKAHVLVHTGLKSQAYAAQCMRAGASAFLSKVDDPEEIGTALKAIASGKTWFPIGAFTSVRQSDFAQNDAQLLSAITRRELKVLHGLALGKSNKQIADDMLLSNKTVSTYKTRLMQKLNTSTLLELIEFAKRNHLV